ncbi:hypothetical protein V6Z12_A08G067000 [Gossypium hirsutum]
MFHHLKILFQNALMNLQPKNRCSNFSESPLHQGQLLSKLLKCRPLLLRNSLVGSLSIEIIQRKLLTLGGTFNFQILSKLKLKSSTPTSNNSFDNFFTENTPLLSWTQINLSSTSDTNTFMPTFSFNPISETNSLSNSGLVKKSNQLTSLKPFKSE